MRVFLASISLLIASFAWGADRQIPRPLAHHPGNVFLQGEKVVMNLARNQIGDWKLTDFDEHTIREGKSEGRSIDLGQLPVGYYELQFPQSHVAIGVIAPLRAPTPLDSPIGTDTAASWFYKTKPEWKSAASLASLAGVNWIRDRLSWRETEPTRGHFVDHSKYDDTARIFHDAGLRILTVMHASPPWANPDPRRFPTDLGDAYRFYNHWASRFKGLVDAFEPWNEADWNHSGAEMASLQKACYLGIKAANPDAIVCQNVFATVYSNTVNDFAANEVWPYFDTMNFHHYQSIDLYPQMYAPFRQISAGRPIWVTEFGTKDVKWSGDAKSQEPDEANLRLQAEGVPKMFAAGLYYKPAAMFYFILGNYAEGQTQFGLLRRDLTPRPGYLSLAAVGRLLAGAKSIGQVKDEQKNLRAFAFSAAPDGIAREVMVAWTTSDQAQLHLPVAPVAMFDCLGREQNVGPQTLKLSTAPVFVVFPQNSMSQFNWIPPPKPAPWRAGKPSAIVLQAAFPASQLEQLLSSDRVAAGSDQPIPLVAYNFSDHAAHVTLKVQAPQTWKVNAPESIDLRPQSRVEVPMTLNAPFQSAKGFHAIRVEATGVDLGTAVLSFNVLPTQASTRP